MNSNFVGCSTGNVGGLGAFQDLVDKVSGAPEQVRIVRRVTHQAAGLDKLTVYVHRRQPVLCCKLQHLALLIADKWI